MRQECNLHSIFSPCNVSVAVGFMIVVIRCFNIVNSVVEIKRHAWFVSLLKWIQVVSIWQINRIHYDLMSLWLAGWRFTYFIGLRFRWWRFLCRRWSTWGRWASRFWVIIARFFRWKVQIVSLSWSDFHDVKNCDNAHEQTLENFKESFVRRMMIEIWGQKISDESLMVTIT